MELQLQLKSLLGAHFSGGGHLEVLIESRQLPDHKNSWEDYVELHEQFPLFHFEDKVQATFFFGWEGGRGGVSN